MEIILRAASPSEIDEAIAIDDDACALYETAGLYFDIGPEHPFAQSEHGRWLLSMQRGLAHFAVATAPVGLLALSVLDGVRYLEQLSVRTAFMRRGIGRRLLEHAIAWADGQPLWLTTYAHLPWNRGFYEQYGFRVVPEVECPRGVVADLAEQRRWLPAPDQRIAMRR